MTTVTAHGCPLRVHQAERQVNAMKDATKKITSSQKSLDSIASDREAIEEKVNELISLAKDLQKVAKKQKVHTDQARSHVEGASTSLHEGLA